MNEINQKPTNIKIHDIVVIHKLQKTDENGLKLGYDFYCKDSIGVAIEITEDSLAMKLADGSEYTYDANKDDKEYYYKVGFGSEIEYEKLIQKDIDKKVRELKEKQEELKDAMVWMHDFKERVSIWNRVMRAIKLI